MTSSGGAPTERVAGGDAPPPPPEHEPTEPTEPAEPRLGPLAVRTAKLRERRRHGSRPAGNERLSPPPDGPDKQTVECYRSLSLSPAPAFIHVNRRFSRRGGCRPGRSAPEEARRDPGSLDDDAQKEPDVTHIAKGERGNQSRPRPMKRERDRERFIIPAP